jgi:predicted ABC-type ATPase
MKEPTKKPDGPPLHGISSLRDIADGSPIAKPPKPAKEPKKQPSLFGLPQKWKPAQKAKFQIPKQEYDTPLLGEVMVTDGIADTSKALRDKKDGRYFKERRKLHKAIVQFHLDKSKPKKEGEPKTVYFLGGGPGSGKTSMFKAGTLGVDPDTVRIDPDEIKTMIPEYRKWLDENYVESAGMVHSESKHITELATASLIDSDSDMVYDTTGDGNYAGMRDRIEEMRRNGHSIVARYTTISKAKAHQINQERFKETGRKVPGHQVDHVHTQVSINVMRAIADGLFDDLELYDNEDFPNEPKLILSVKNGELEILDNDKVKDFIAKAGPGLQPGRKSSDPMHLTTKSAVEAGLESLENSGSEAEIAAWKFYRGSGYRNINGTLRDPNFIEDDAQYNEIVDAITAIDELFNNHSVSVMAPTTVYRGTVDTFRADDVPEEYLDQLSEIIAKTKQSGGKPILQDRESLEIIADAMNAGIDPKKPFTYTEDGYMSTGREVLDAQSFAAGATLSPELLESIVQEEDLTGIPVVMEMSVPPGTRFVAGQTMESESVFDRGTGTRIMRYEVVEGPEGKFHIRAYAEMKPAKGKPPKLEKVDLPEGEQTNIIFDDDDAM